MIRALLWLWARVGGVTLATFVLLLVALLSAAWSMSEIVRGLDFELLATIVTVGAVTGWLMARSTMRGRGAVVAALAGAFVTVLVRVGQLGGGFFAVLVAFGRSYLELMFGRFEAEPILEATRPFGEGVITLAARLDAWARGILGGQPAPDLVASALVWSFLVWLAAAWGAWMLRRKGDPFFALLPLLLFLTFVLAYTRREFVVLAILIAAFLALMVVVPHWARQERWEKEHVPWAQELGFDLAIVTVPAILGIVTAVVLLPAISPTDIATAVQRWFQPDSNRYTAYSDSLGLNAAPRPTTVFDTIRSPGLPRSHLIGAAPERLQALAFVMETDDANPTRYYWQSSTYDIYTGRGWLTSETQTNRYGANEALPQGEASFTQTLHETVRDAGGGGFVYAAGSLVSVDRDFQAAWRANGDLFSAQVQAGTYGVVSRVQTFRPDDLRAAGSAYPEWVAAEYLALPQDLPPRVLGLARDLTATAPNGYDRALAIENYLHTIPYTLELPAPPPDRDVADYFLFDLRRGYCDYYATAMAVLARAAGLPARIAVGYAPGTYDESTRTYRVIEGDAHSWTQVYFPKYGWVDFEPTSGRPELQVNAPENPIGSPPTNGETGTGGTATWQAGGIGNPWVVGAGAALMAGLALVVVVVVDSYRLRRLPPSRATAVVYQRLRRTARLLDPDVTASYTPSQVGRVLEGYLESGERPKRLQRILRSAAGKVADVIEAYSQVTFGGRTPEAEKGAAPVRKWLILRGQLGLALAAHFVEERLLHRLKREGEGQGAAE